MNYHQKNFNAKAKEKNLKEHFAEIMIGFDFSKILTDI